MAQSVEKLTSSLAVTHYDFDPDGTDPVDIAWVDMKEHSNFMCSFFRTVGTSNVDTFRIIANSASDGSGSDVVIVTHAVGSQPNAVGDYIFLECTAEQVGAAGTDLRYVSAQVEFATGTDEGVVTYIRCGGREYTGLSSDTVA